MFVLKFVLFINTNNINLQRNRLNQKLRANKYGKKLTLKKLTIKILFLIGYFINWTLNSFMRVIIIEYSQ